MTKSNNVCGINKESGRCKLGENHETHRCVKNEKTNRCNKLVVDNKKKNVSPQPEPQPPPLVVVKKTKTTTNNNNNNNKICGVNETTGRCKLGVNNQVNKCAYDVNKKRCIKLTTTTTNTTTNNNNNNKNKKVGKKDDDCLKVLTIPQFLGTCWFNALLMALFYSDYMRAYLKKNMMKDYTNNENNNENNNNNNIGKNDKLLSSIKEILSDKFHKRSEETFSLFHKKLRPENILNSLHKLNPKMFYIHTGLGKTKLGNRAEYYLPNLLTYLGVNSNVLYFDMKSSYYYNDKKLSSLYYSRINKDPFVKKKELNYYHPTKTVGKKYRNKNVDIIVITTILDNEPTNYKNKYTSTFELNDKMEFNNKTYTLDSLLLSSFNIDTCKKGHVISGVTCNNKRYMYNGWIRNTNDPAMKKNNKSNISTPCELMEYDWLHNASDFCLSTKACKLELKTKKSKVCFNINKGVRTYIYIKS